MGAIADYYLDSNRIKPPKGSPKMNLTIRRATTADQFAIRRLAVLDSASPPTGEVLLGEMNGELWAAVSVGTGDAIADPFRPSGDIVELLRVHSGSPLAQAA
jgi:hypothetical protein